MVVNMASFLRVPGRVPGGPGGSGHNMPPPPRGPLPAGTDWVLNPQNAAVILSGCQIDSLGNVERGQANIFLEQLPATLVVEGSHGLAYADLPPRARALCCERTSAPQGRATLSRHVRLAPLPNRASTETGCPSAAATRQSGTPPTPLC